MEREHWIDRWRKGQIGGFHQQEVHPALPSHWAGLGAPRDAPVFVPLCGKSRDMLWLRAQGHSVLGVELSPIAVRDFFAEAGLTPDVDAHGPFERWRADRITLLCGDFFALTSDDLAEVRGVYDRAALIALPPPMRVRYAKTLKEHLPPEAAMLLVTFDYAQHEMQGPPFSVPEPEVRDLYGDAFEITPLARADALGTEPRWRERGVSRMEERTFRLARP